MTTAARGGVDLDARTALLRRREGLDDLAEALADLLGRRTSLLYGRLTHGQARVEAERESDLDLATLDELHERRQLEARSMSFDPLGEVRPHFAHEDVNLAAGA